LRAHLRERQTAKGKLQKANSKKQTAKNKLRFSFCLLLFALPKARREK
jgi:hypothetical protein